MTNQPLRLTGDPEADALLSEDDNALLIGMVLDQQVPMEKAFSGPLVIAQRMGGRLDVAKIAAMRTAPGDPSISRSYGQAHPADLPSAHRGLRRPGNKHLEGCSVR